MIGVRQSIYWKLLLAFIASIILTASVMVLMYVIFAPDIEVHPHIKKSLIDETRAITEKMAAAPATFSASLSDIARNIHETDHANIRIFDRSGRELGAWMDERLSDTRRISPTVIEETLRNGEYLELIFPRWIHVVSMPLQFGEQQETLILQIYYPLIEKSILPQGIPTVMVLVLLCALTAVFSRIFTKPIRELTHVARQMAAGKLGLQITTTQTRDEIGELGTAFNEMSARLAQFHRSRSELLADISHEIRSPLGRIQTDAEILMDKDVEKEAQKQHLLQICEEVRQIDHLIDDLLLLSRIENNQLAIERLPGPLEEVISREAARFSLQMEEKSITLKKNIRAALPAVSIDQKRIGQVVANLLMNAIRYTPTGGTIEIGAQAEEAQVTVWVKDSGPGIPREDLPHIFERFYRVDKSRSRATGGTGLGLAIARRFVEAHGGTIRAESEEQKGTCITFTLPRTA